MRSLECVVRFACLVVLVRKYPVSIKNNKSAPIFSFAFDYLRFLGGRDITERGRFRGLRVGI